MGSSKGGKTTATILREKALVKYYENPSVCLFCGRVILVADGHKVRESRRKKFCNRICSDSYRIGSTGPTGHLSAGVVLKISKALTEKHRQNPVSKETRAKLSKAMRRNRVPLSEERKRKLHEGRMRSGTTDETRRKLSLNACSNRHKFNNFRHVPFISYTRLDNTEVRLRGSYEFRFAKYLDGRGIKWEYGKPLGYLDKNGVQKYMLPDFFIVDTCRYFDTKGYLSKECAEKLELIREQGTVVRLVFLKDIEALEGGKKALEDF